MENKLWSSKLTNESRPLENDKYGVDARTVSHTSYNAGAILRLEAGTAVSDLLRRRQTPEIRLSSLDTSTCLMTVVETLFQVQDLI